jgi:hypothetical protein
MFLTKPKAPRTKKTEKKDHRPSHEAALEVLYPQPPEATLNLSGGAYNIARTFLNNLKKEKLKPEVLDLIGNNDDFVEECRKNSDKLAEQQAQASAMQSIVDKAFAAIEPYIDEVNQALEQFDLKVASTPPDRVTEDKGASGLKTYYRARISTARLSIVIRGSEGVVDFYLLPSSQVIGLSRVENAHLPLMQFEAVAGSDSWEVEQKPLTDERLERYCLLLFNHLLEETKAEMVGSFA